MSYRQSQSLWPLLRTDRNLNTKIRLAEQRIEDLNNNQVIITLKNDATEDQARFLIDEIKNVVGVKNIKFISKDEAFQKFEMINDKDSELFNDLVTKDMVQAYIEVHVTDIENMSPIIKQIAQTKSFVEKVDVRTNLK